jgi:hypothetical protein
MAYGLKYKFKFEATHDLTYEVRLLEQDFEGTAIQRPLGSAPVIHMQDNDPIRATSVDLVLECQTDGEFVDLYTSNPRQFKVQIYRGTASKIWEGFVATELYSEPDIAPPYDVKVTATDGLGVLKEYQYETGWGGRTVRDQLQQMLLSKTGLSLDLYTVSQLREYGETAISFLDEVKIDMDYMEGKNCYEVLCELLTSMRCVITQWRDSWVIIRETDVVIQSDGDVLGMESDNRGTNDTYSLEIEYMTARLGKMGGANTDMWPVGYLTRRIVPAKKSVKVTSDWHLKNGSPALTSWSGHDDAHTDVHSANPNNVFWALGTGYAYTEGRIAASMNTYNFQRDIKVTLKVSGSSFSHIRPRAHVQVLAGWVSGGTTKYYSPSDGWDASSPDNDQIPVTSTNVYGDPNACETVEVIIPAAQDTNAGYFAINVVGLNIELYDVDVQLVAGGGYEDTILIDNGARGSAPGISISGGRELALNLLPIDFVAGVFYHDYGSSSSDISTAFSDGSSTNKDFMSLAALTYAKQHAAPRIEVSGVLDFPSTLTFHPLFVKSHNDWALVSSFDWNLKESEFSFKAVTLPTASLVVDSETITTK